jgi:hypothetical protein
VVPNPESPAAKADSRTVLVGTGSHVRDLKTSVVRDVG